MSTRVLAIVAAFAIGAPAWAGGDPPPERIPHKARELVAKGRKHHSAGDYGAAVDAFKEAYVLAPSTGLLFNIAQAYRLGGDCDQAAWMYRRFLDADPPGAQRALAEAHLAAVEKCGQGGLRISVAPPRIDTDVPVPALAVRKARMKKRPKPMDPSSENTLQRTGTTAMVVGGIALAGAAMFALDARDAARAVEDTYRRGGRWDDIEDADHRGQRSSTIATALGIGGGVAVLSGAVLYGLGRRYEPARRFAVGPTRGGAQVNLSWGF